jgi:hypothetical protein
MFLGHFAVALGAKRLAPGASLGTLFLACQLADLVWPNLVLGGVEHLEIAPGATAVTPIDFVSYPYSHSLVGLYWLLRRDRTAAWVVGALVLSHWLLDVASHRPDMPLAPGLDTRVGLGLWYSVPATVIVEGLLFVAGLFLYTRATRARDRTGTLALWGLVAFLALIYAANFSGTLPPSTDAVAWTAQAMWLLVLWGWWVDRHREPVAAAVSVLTPRPT